MPERLHPVSPLRRQPYAIHDKSQSIVYHAANKAAHKHTAHVDVSHELSSSIEIGIWLHRSAEDTPRIHCMQHLVLITVARRLKGGRVLEAGAPTRIRWFL